MNTSDTLGRSQTSIFKVGIDKSPLDHAFCPMRILLSTKVKKKYINVWLWSTVIDISISSVYIAIDKINFIS